MALPIRIPRPLLLLAALAPAAALLSGCPPQGVVCREGLARCGEGCADLTGDENNCGACGRTCGPAQTCQAGGCQCQAGFTRCGGACVDVRSDPRYCGRCDLACAANQVCEAGACKASCTLGTSNLCGQACVDLGSDVANCGECGRACKGSQSCRQGICTFDVVAACGTTGQVAGVQASTSFVGPRQPMGTAPGAMATFHDELLVLDGIDRRLLEARLDGLELLPGFTPVGAVPNHLLVEDPYVYVVNAGTGTLQVLQREGTPLPQDGGADGGAGDGGSGSDGGTDGGRADGGDGGIHSPLDGGHFPFGLKLATVAELFLGANTYPQAIAKLGRYAYVPLYGGYGRAAAAAGQKVVRVDLANPKAPQVTGTYELSGLDLRPLDGGSPVARPFAIAFHQGQLYVALNNLNPDTYAPEGAGLLARIDPGTGAVTGVSLGPTCLNATWVVSDGPRLYVSCAGRTEYNPDFSPRATVQTGVVVLENDQVVSTWSVQCPVGTGPDAGCVPPSVGRFAAQAGQLFVGDQAAGRLFVLAVDGGALSERRGYAADAGPLLVCPIPAGTGYSNVSDVLAVP